MFLTQAGSRNPSEFDITEHAKPNEQNTLAVRVYQFCDGSYIEDQVCFDTYRQLLGLKLTPLRTNGG